MAISFDNIPATLRVPGVFSEVDNSQAVSGPQAIQYRRLLIGQMLSSGTATAAELVRVTSEAQAATLFGEGSMLHGMCLAALTQDDFIELWVMPLDDDGAANAAAGSVKFGGAPTAAGTLNLYIAGRRVRVAVGSGDTPGDVATAAAAAINAMAGNDALPVTAAVDGVEATQVNITARNKGEAGNDIDIRLNYYDDEVTPAGLTVTITAMSGGTANPDISSALAALGDEWFQAMAMPYTDSSNLAALEAELADRFGPMREIEGHGFAAARGSHGQLGTLGDGRNSPHVTIVQAAYEPMPPYEKAAETASIAAYYASIDPARPLQSLPYKWCLPAKTADQFTLEERNLLLYDGIATTTVDAGGVMRTERLITTYKQNAAGGQDVSYLDCETLFTLMFIRHDWRDYVKRKYPRHKLANDGSRFGPGQAVATPKLMKAEYVAKAREWEELALVENIDQMKADLISERNPSDPNRLDLLLPPDLVNQLRIVGNKIAFRL